jgi:exonuclease III
MKLISWNIRGINGLSKHRMIHRKVTQEKPRVLMIQETKCSSSTLDALEARLWKGSHSITVDAEGASGGLVILWNPAEIILDNFLATSHTITASFQFMGSGVQGFITNVYGPQLPVQKALFLDYMSSLGQQINMQHWIVSGDFNMITSLEEKKGGRRHLEQEGEAFSDVIEQLHMVDMKTSNGVFTWNNRRGGEH